MRRRAIAATALGATQIPSASEQIANLNKKHPARCFVSCFAREVYKTQTLVQLTARYDRTTAQWLGASAWCQCAFQALSATVHGIAATVKQLSATISGSSALPLAAPSRGLVPGNRMLAR